MILVTFQQIDWFTIWVRALRGKLRGSGHAWLRCNALEWETIRPVWRRSRLPFQPARGMPRKLAGFHPQPPTSLACRGRRRCRVEDFATTNQ